MRLVRLAALLGEVAADAVAAREFLWQRWSRRSARSQSAE
jgi:hypothetical protein